MPATSYTNYLRELKTTVDRIRDRPFEYDDALIQMALCKNGFGYKSRDLLRAGSLYSEHQMGPLSVRNWQTDGEEVGRAEIDQFFALPVIYAYSDKALDTPKNPLETAHWDATVAIVEVFEARKGSTPRRQRMLFAGFSDIIHAEFFLAVERDYIVHDGKPGSHFFEWTPASEPRELTSAVISDDHHERQRTLRWPMRDRRLSA